jgi:RsiW-degrading membrane proteinase PrsW (M82 family)
MVEYRVIIIAALIGVVPAVGIGWLMLRGDKKGKGLGNRLLFRAFSWGVLTAVPASVLQIINMENGGGNYLMALFGKISIFQGNYVTVNMMIPLVLVAVIEELSKGVGIILALRSFSRSKRASRMKINPGLIAGLIIGLAFGVTENGVYFANNFNSQSGSSMASIIILRFILSTSAHIIYSGLLGAFLVDALVAKSIISRVIKGVLALLVPVSIHAGFNGLISTEYGLYTVPLMVAGFALLAFKAFWPLRKEIQSEESISLEAEDEMVGNEHKVVNSTSNNSYQKKRVKNFKSSSSASNMRFNMAIKNEKSTKLYNEEQEQEDLKAIDSIL